MKILNVIKCEFIKNYTLKKIIAVLIALLLSIIVTVEFVNQSFPNDGYIDKAIVDNLYQRAKSEVEKNPTLANEFVLYYWKLHLEIPDYLISESWKNEITFQMLELDCKIYIIDKMIENPNISLQFEKPYGDYAYIQYEKFLEEIENSNISLEELKKQCAEEKESYQKILNDNKYYQYIEFLLAKEEYTEKRNAGLIYEEDGKESISKETYQKYYQMIIDQKIESFDDYRTQNIFLRMELNMDTKIDTPQEFTNNLGTINYSNYNSYLRQRKEYQKLEKEYKAILDYSILHQKSQDSLLLDTGVDNYVTSKTIVNLVLKIGIVILLLVIVTSGDIVSGEHATKTDKMLLTEPISRTKVLLGKFLYLVLHTYIIWIVAFLLIYIYAGIRFGFYELITPKLVYFNGSVIEVNYIFHMILQIFICGIPLLAIIAIMLLLSVATFSTVITNFVSILLSFYSVLIGSFVYLLYSTFGLGFWSKFMEWTPFLYANQEFMLKSGYTYLTVVGIIDVNPLKGIAVSMITIILSLSLACFIYKKRDIKN